MKTIQDLYNEVMGNEELKAQFIETANAGKQEEFLKEHGCEASLEEAAAFLKAKAEEDAPLSLDELENSAGGACTRQTTVETLASIITAGIYCAGAAYASAASNGKHVGQRNENEGRLCNDD